MTFGILLALAAQATGGVAVDSVPQIGIATRHARCIVRQVGVAPAEDAARAARIQGAVKGCREFVESDYAQGRILLGDRDQLVSVEAGAILGDICDDGGRGPSTA